MPKWRELCIWILEFMLVASVVTLVLNYPEVNISQIQSTIAHLITDKITYPILTIVLLVIMRRDNRISEKEGYVALAVIVSAMLILL